MHQKEEFGVECSKSQRWQATCPEREHLLSNPRPLKKRRERSPTSLSDRAYRKELKPCPSWLGNLLEAERRGSDELKNWPFNTRYWNGRRGKENGLASVGSSQTRHWNRKVTREASLGNESVRGRPVPAREARRSRRSGD